MYHQRVEVKQVFLADKGLDAGQFALIPVAYDGALYTFTVTPNGYLFICNGANIIQMRLGRPPHLLRSPLGKKIEFWGIAASTRLLYLFCSNYTIAVLDWEGRELRRFGGGHGNKLGQFKGAPPFSMGLKPSGNLLVTDYDYKAKTLSLYEFDPDGRYLREYPGLEPNGYRNFAVDSHGRLFIYRAQKSLNKKEEVVEVSPPISLLRRYSKARFELLDMDRWGGLYWMVNDERQSKVVRVGSDRSVSWSVALEGPGTVLPLRGKFQVDWLDVDQEGRLYVFAWPYEGMRRVVGIYQISVR